MSDEPTSAQTKASERQRRGSAKTQQANESECLAASFFALKSGGVDNAKKALQDLHRQHASTIKFVIQCGGVDEALDRLDRISEHLQAA
jgi:hypothetical protein